MWSAAAQASFPSVVRLARIPARGSITFSKESFDNGWDRIAEIDDSWDFVVEIYDGWDLRRSAIEENTEVEMMKKMLMVRSFDGVDMVDRES